MNIKDLARYFLFPLIKTSSTIDHLLMDRRKLAYTAIILLFMGSLYTLSVTIAHSNGFGASVQPWLIIPADEWYYWARFYTIPLFFFLPIAYAGICRLISAMLGGKGDFESIFSMYGIVIVLPLFLTMWLPETSIFIFLPGLAEQIRQGLHPLPLWIDIPRQVIGVLWPLAITILGIKKIEQFNWFKSVLASILAFIPYTILILVFIR